MRDRERDAARSRHIFFLVTEYRGVVHHHRVDAASPVPSAGCERAVARGSWSTRADRFVVCAQQQLGSTPPFDATCFVSWRSGPCEAVRVDLEAVGRAACTACLVVKLIHLTAFFRFAATPQELGLEILSKSLFRVKILRLEVVRTQAPRQLEIQCASEEQLDIPAARGACRLDPVSRYFSADFTACWYYCAQLRL